ncbi:MAG: winged helix-turn-helix domain-containing protein [Alphaproteobacteria bacterium]
MKRPIPNKRARRIALNLAGLTENPTRPFGKKRLVETVNNLGFVQVDTISAVARAHHHILFTRAHNYHPDHLRHALEKERTLFEDWSHDAAVIPTHFRPYWATRFQRYAARVENTPRWLKRFGDDRDALLQQVLQKVEAQGPLSAADLKSKDTPKRKGDGWWDWAPEKTALDYLWRTGTLAVTRRDGFGKVYDLAHRVIPLEHQALHAADDCLDWSAREALKRLGFATPKQIAHFFLHISIAEARAWAQENAEEIELTGADGTRKTFYALPETLATRLKAAPKVARIISPFDPLIHDRERTAFLFGFEYRIEVFVPAAKRKYGYFTCPILVGDELVGRIDLKAHRTHAEPHLAVNGLWFENGQDTRENRVQIDEALHRLEPFSLIAL